MTRICFMPAAYACAMTDKAEVVVDSREDRSGHQGFGWGLRRRGMISYFSLFQQSGQEVCGSEMKRLFFSRFLVRFLIVAISRAWTLIRGTFFSGQSG